MPNSHAPDHVLASDAGTLDWPDAPSAEAREAAWAYLLDVIRKSHDAAMDDAIDAMAEEQR